MEEKGEIVVFVNGVQLPGVAGVNVSYASVPTLCQCSVSLRSEGGDYIRFDIKGRNQTVPSLTMEKLRVAAETRKIQVEFCVPIFKDNDIVHVFEKREGFWWWVFHGYVTTVSYSDALDGRQEITLNCESGLKALRHNFLLVNAFLLPKEFTKDGVSNHITKVFTAFKGINTTGKPYWEQIQQLFEQGANDSKFYNGEGKFKVDIRIWYEDTDVEAWSDYLYNTNNTQLKTLEDLEAQIVYGGNATLTLPNEKYVYVINIGNIPELAKLKDVLTAAFALQRPTYLMKLQILQDIISNLNLVAYTTPRGDVVIEPLMNGLKEGFYSSGFIDNSEIISHSYTFSGNDIATAALMTVGMYMPLEAFQTTETLMQTLRPDQVVLDEDAVKAYGVRFVKQQMMNMHLLDKATAELYGRFLLAQSWAMAKTAKVTSRWNGTGGVNRPQYVQKYDGWFLPSSLSIQYDPNGLDQATWQLGYGMLWSGSDWTPDIGYAISNIALLFDVAARLREQSRQQAIKDNFRRAANVRGATSSLTNLGMLETRPLDYQVTQIQTVSPAWKNPAGTRESATGVQVTAVPAIRGTNKGITV